MEAKEPTQEQIKEFWDKLRVLMQRKSKPTLAWEFTDGDWEYPSINLNNLFAFAVPKAIDKIMAEQECSSDFAYAILFKKWLQKLEIDIPNHERTLFWAIYLIFKEIK